MMSYAIPSPDKRPETTGPKAVYWHAYFGIQATITLTGSLHSWTSATIARRVEAEMPADGRNPCEELLRAGGLQVADVVPFYFADHGLQVRGANYLVAIGANPVRGHMRRPAA